MIEFNSFEIARAYYDSDAYHAALKAFGDSAVVGEIRAVEGVD